MANKGLALLNKLVAQCETVDKQYTNMKTTLEEARKLATCNEDRDFITEQVELVDIQLQTNTARMENLKQRVVWVQDAEKKKAAEAARGDPPSAKRAHFKTKEEEEMEAYCKAYSKAGINEIPRIKAWLQTRGIKFNEGRTDMQWISKLSRIPKRGV